ncbi:MAG: agmatinase [Hyphomicrobiaceae bacterium]
MTLALSYRSAATGFLEPDRDLPARDEDAKAVVVPFGLEHSVSYGGGTAAGPDAILSASHQLELFDEELWREPYRDFGITTLKDLSLPAELPAALDLLEGVVQAIIAQNRFPLILGGEHALTAGAIRPFAKANSELVVLQFDAHADLRDGYLGEHYSHASAMRRVLDHESVSVVSVGVRAISESEARFYDANRDRIAIFWAKDQDRWATDEIVARLQGKQVYVTFDVDVLDAAEMPATGTPSPGGLRYWQALMILKRAAEVATFVGGDVVELAPIKGLHAFDYTAAAIAYKLMSYALSGTAPR